MSASDPNQEPFYSAPGASTERLEAPGAGAAGSPSMPSRAPWPRVSDHAVEPETWQEMHNGEIVQVQPALSPHARTQAQLGFVLRGNAAPGFVVETDLLTRTSYEWDFASDVCIRKEGIDPDSGCRYLEELAFEVNYSQSEGRLRDKMQQMAQRGVRRVFVIDVDGDAEGANIRIGPVREWLGEPRGWRVLGADEVIEDSSLRQSVPVRALLDVLEADNTVARGLIAGRNPVIAELEEQRFRDGEKKGFEDGEKHGALVGLRTALLALLAHRNFLLDAGQRARIEACTDMHQLDTWLARAVALADGDSADALFT